jgi:hypothetical protein
MPMALANGATGATGAKYMTLDDWRRTASYLAHIKRNGVHCDLHKIFWILLWNITGNTESELCEGLASLGNFHVSVELHQWHVHDGFIEKDEGNVIVHRFIIVVRMQQPESGSALILVP